MRVSIQIGITIFMVCSPILIAAAAQATLTAGTVVTPAPAAFDNATNGVVSQTVFDADRLLFEEKETIEDGLGPVYNAAGCADCHANPVVGGGSQVTELRAGHWDRILGQFAEHPGGSLIQDRAINANIQEQIFPGYEVRALRLSSSILGLGFVEAPRRQIWLEESACQSGILFRRCLSERSCLRISHANSMKFSALSQAANDGNRRFAFSALRVGDVLLPN